MRRALTSAFLLVLAMASLRGETLLVAPFEDSTGRPEYAGWATHFPDLVTACLTGAEGVEVVEREKLDLLMAEAGLRWENVMKEKPTEKIANLLQARYLLRGGVLLESGQPRAHALLYETATARLVKSWDSPSGDLSQQACQIADKTSAALHSKIPQRPELPSDPDPEMSRLLMTGLGYYYTGQYERALAEFIKAVERDSQRPEARYWLARTYASAGLQADALQECALFLKTFPQHPNAKEVSSCFNIAQGSKDSNKVKK